jgi:hypothetical protein
MWALFGAGCHWRCCWVVGEDGVAIDVVVLSDDLGDGIAEADFVEDAVFAGDDEHLVSLDQVRTGRVERGVVGENGIDGDAVAGGDAADRVAALGAVLNDGAAGIDDIGEV